MKLCTPLLASMISGALLSAATSAQPDAKKAWTPRLMMQVKKVGAVAPSPDGKRVVIAVREAVMSPTTSEYLTHLHLANVKGGETAQLTQGDKSCDEPQWSPDGAWIAFLSGRAGKNNVWLILAKGGEARQLTAFKTSVTSFKWSPDSQWIAFTALDPLTPEDEKARQEKNDVRLVDENIRMSRLHVMSVKGDAEPRLLTPVTISVGGPAYRVGQNAFDWSPDGRSIVFCHTPTPRHDDWPSADISIVDVASGKVRPLAQTRAAEFTPFYSPDGRWIAFVASVDPPTWAGTGRVHVVPASGGTPRPLAELGDGFGRYSDLIGWSADGKKLYLTEAHGTVMKIIALPLEGGPESVSKDAGFAAAGVHLNASRTMLGFAWESLTGPPEAVVSDVDRFAPVQVSRVNEAFANLPLGRTEIVRWKTADGFESEGLLTLPVGYEKGRRFPLLVIIHGGPMGVFMQSYVAAPGLYPVAAFAERGYAVLRPNPRGSSGYGKKFRHANYRDWGGGDFKDIMAGVDRVIDLGVADANRLGVMGWSYGGFMTAWTITHTHRFKAASVGAAVTNLVSFTGTADIPGFLPDYFRKEFWDDPDIYRAHSPVHHVKGVKTPTLIQHGERDARVPLTQGQEFYNALKRQGSPVKMVIYPRTPHGIEEPRLLLDCMERNVEWFDRHLRGS